MIENTNAMKSNIRYPTNSSLASVTKKPSIVMITTAHMPAIMIWLLSIEKFE